MLMRTPSSRPAWEAGDLAGEPGALALQAAQRGLEGGVRLLQARSSQLQAVVPVRDALGEAGDGCVAARDERGDAAADPVARDVSGALDPCGPAVLRGRGTGGEHGGHGLGVLGVGLLELRLVEHELAVAVGLDAD